jgi:hypothetical protein
MLRASVTPEYMPLATEAGALPLPQEESDDAMQDAEASPMGATLGQQMAMMA